MKRLGWIGGFAALLLVAASGVASARGGGFHGGGGFRGGAGSFHGASAFHGTPVAGGWRGGGHPTYGGGHPSYGGGWRGAPTHSGGFRGPSYSGDFRSHGYAVAPYGGWGAHPYSAVGIGIRPSPRHVWVPGYWGYRSGVRVWLGGAWLLPQTDWISIAPHWQWDGYRWFWQDGYYAPPY